MTRKGRRAGRTTSWRKRLSSIGVRSLQRMAVPADRMPSEMLSLVFEATKIGSRCLRRTLVVGLILAGVMPPIPAVAQSNDAAYCARLGYLALRYTGSAGAEGRLAPDLSTLGALDDCNKGNTAAGIAVLEKKLLSHGFTLPKR